MRLGVAPLIVALAGTAFGTGATAQTRTMPDSVVAVIPEGFSPLFWVRRPHPLGSEPGSDEERVAVIGGDYHLEPSEVRGDWIRVTLEQPSDYCLDDLEPVVATGWIGWRSPDKGRRLWYDSRGC